jgi:hypothetical protein
MHLHRSPSNTVNALAIEVQRAVICFQAMHDDQSRIVLAVLHESICLRF